MYNLENRPYFISRHVDVHHTCGIKAKKLYFHFKALSKFNNNT